MLKKCGTGDRGLCWLVEDLVGKGLCTIVQGCNNHGVGCVCEGGEVVFGVGTS